MKKATEKKNGNKGTAAASKASSSKATTNPKPAPEKKASARELDKYGFSVGSKRSKAVALLATGKHTVAEALKLTDGYGLSKTLRALQERGFKLVKDADGKCTITGSGK